MAFVNERNPARTVDYDRNIILKGVGGARDQVTLFELSIDGKIVKFGAEYNLHPITNDAASINWNIFQIKIPDELDIKKENLRNVIVEALDAFGLASNKKNIDAVTVSVSPNLKVL